MLENIKVKLYVTTICILMLVLSIFMTAFLFVICYLITNEMFILYVFPFFFFFQLIGIIVLNKLFSKQRDLIINNHEIIQNGITIINKNEILSIKRINFLKTEIIFLKNGLESKIIITVTKQKEQEIKNLLGIYE